MKPFFKVWFAQHILFVNVYKYYEYKHFTIWLYFEVTRLFSENIKFLPEHYETGSLQKNEKKKTRRLINQFWINFRAKSVHTNPLRLLYRIKFTWCVHNLIIVLSFFVLHRETSWLLIFDILSNEQNIVYFWSHILFSWWNEDTLLKDSQISDTGGKFRGCNF